MRVLDKQLLDLEAEYLKQKAELEKKLARSTDIPTIEKEIAELLHSKLCHWNHTDGCNWFYDNGSWNESSRQEYLKKAKNVLKIASADLIKEIIERIACVDIV
jgi:hypothetical protein